MNVDHTNPIADKQPVLLQLLPSLHSGGVERGTIDVTKAAIKAGFKVIVASAGGYMTHQVVSAGGVHVDMPLVNRNPIALWKNKKRIEKLIKEYQVDIVHARSRGPAWSGYFAAKKMNVPFVTTMHGNHSMNFPFKKSYNKIMTKGERVIAISEFIRDHMMNDYHTPSEKITVVPRGVDISQFDVAKVSERRLVQMVDRLRLPEDKHIVLLPGRLTRWKGQHVLLEALKYLSKKDIYCVLLGDDEKHPAYREELRKTILSEGLSSYVNIVGNVNDMPAAYRLANVVLSTSVRPEAFGRVPAEAGAMERLVIAPNHGGAQEIIEHGKTGWLVEPDNAKALADAITHALSLSDAERQEMEKAAKKRVCKRFTVGEMCASTIALYRDVIEGNHPVIDGLDDGAQSNDEASLPEKSEGDMAAVSHDQDLAQQDQPLTDVQLDETKEVVKAKTASKKTPAKKATKTTKAKTTKAAASKVTKTKAVKKVTKPKTVAKKPVAKAGSVKSDTPKKRGRPKKKVS